MQIIILKHTLPTWLSSMNDTLMSEHKCDWINSVLSMDAIKLNKYWSTLVRVMTCHYLNQCWFITLGAFNALCPSDAIRQYRSGSALAQVMACCLMAPSHYLNQCWLIISGVLWHSPEGYSYEMLKISTLDVSLKITNSRLHPHLPGTNELTCTGEQFQWILARISITTMYLETTGFAPPPHLLGDQWVNLPLSPPHCPVLCSVWDAQNQ